MGYIAYLNVGQSPAALTFEGLNVTALTALTAMPSTVLVGPPVVETNGSSAPQLVGPVPTSAAAYALVYPRASEAALVSCDYQLSDKPADKAYISSAEAIMTSEALVTQQQLETDPVFFISDDPLDHQFYIVTVKVLGDPIAPPPGTPQGVTILSTHSYAALVDAQTAAVVAFGSAPW